MLRVTIDSNVYISAFQFGGEPLRLLMLAAESRIEVAISSHIIEEVTRTLREKFGWPEDRVENARGAMSRLARLVTPLQALAVIKEDPADNRILECAAAAGSEYIVTGDKDLHRLKQYENVRIVKVSEVLKTVDG